ncbi:MAG: hypothetical protein M1150_02875 [Patescibacteria group bacterium]|nr:hypothetical protein [Patescibacteria group bacterium]
MKNQTIEQAIQKGLIYLGNHQETEGNFLSFSSNRPEFKKAWPTNSMFQTALIFSCLNDLKETPITKIIKRKAASFLLTQKNEYWSFNYWTRNSLEAKEKAYPDDLDCTFCSLSALAQYWPDLVDGEVIARIVSLLTNLEKDVGGPYKTWVVPKDFDKIWRDVDLVVNANIAYFLSLKKINLPNLNSFLNSNIEKENFSSPYYFGPLPTIYFISRLYKEARVELKNENKEILKKFLFEKISEDEIKRNSLSCALKISSLLNLGVNGNKLRKEVNFLLSNSVEDHWSPYPFVLESVKKEIIQYAGSSPLTTAFCLEALNKYLMRPSIKETTALKNFKAKENAIREKIIKEVNDNLSKLSLDLKVEAVKNLNMILSADKDGQVALTPFYFWVALGENGKKIDDDLLIKLGEANLYGWIAYTIYDNFLDGEGDPKSLPTANVCLRELTNIFNNLLPDQNFNTFAHQIINEMENANTWEVSHCRLSIEKDFLDMKKAKLPDWANYEKLAERSLGHSLGPVVILSKLGCHATDSEVKNLLSFFTHYLIAKQLNDDAHDWEKDLKNGHSSPIVTLLLRKSGLKSQIKISKLTPKLQEIFWYETIDQICEDVFKNINLAKSALSKVSLVTKPLILESILSTPQQSAQKALTERQEILKFLEAYKSEGKF